MTVMFLEHENGWQMCQDKLIHLNTGLAIRESMQVDVMTAARQFIN